MKYCETKSYTLRAVPYKEGRYILTTFTRELGMVSCMVHGVSKKNIAKNQLISPLCYAELILETTKGMYKVKDCSIASLHLPLRNSLPHISAASSMAKLLLTTQNDPAPKLFDFFTNLLKILPQKEPHHILSLFVVKLMKHDGLYAEEHKAATLSHTDWSVVQRLASLKSLSELPRIPSQTSTAIFSWATTALT